MEKAGGASLPVEVLGLGPAGMAYPHLRFVALDLLSTLSKGEGPRALLRQHRRGANLDMLVSAMHRGVGALASAEVTDRAALSCALLLFSRLMWDRDFFGWMNKRAPPPAAAADAPTRGEMLIEAASAAAIASGKALEEILDVFGVDALEDLPPGENGQFGHGWPAATSAGAAAAEGTRHKPTKAEKIKLRKKKMKEEEAEQPQPVENEKGSDVSTPLRMAARAWLMLSKLCLMGPHIAASMARNETLVAAAITACWTIDGDEDLGPGALAWVHNSLRGCGPEAGKAMTASLVARMKAANRAIRLGLRPETSAIRYFLSTNKFKENY